MWDHLLNGIEKGAQGGYRCVRERWNVLRTSTWFDQTGLVWVVLR